jgi:hypothetical protein
MSRVRTWYSDVDVALSDVSTAAKACHSVLFAIKEILLGGVNGTHGWEGASPSTAHWTLDSSSDGTTASSADNLGGSTFTDAKWVRASAGSAHSWWAAHSNEGLYVCFDYATGADYQINIYFALSAFTGGTTTNRPTSTTEWNLQGSPGGALIAFWSNNAAAGSVHVCRDANGGFYCLVNQTSQSPGPGCSIIGVKIDQANTADSAPFVSTAVASFGGNTWTGNGYAGGRNATNTASISLGLGVPSFPSGSITGLPVGLNADGKADLYDVPIYYQSGSTTGAKGRLPDAQWGNMLGGRQEPASGNVERILPAGCGMWQPFSVYGTF